MEPQVKATKTSFWGVEEPCFPLPPALRAQGPGSSLSPHESCLSRGADREGKEETLSRRWGRGPGRKTHEPPWNGASRFTIVQCPHK